MLGSKRGMQLLTHYGCTVEVWDWISNCIPNIIMMVITYTLILILSGKCQITQPFTPAETLASDQEAHRLGFFAHNQIH